MNRAQEQRHLAQANGHIAELKVQIVRQRAIVKYALDTGQQSEMAESMLLALEDSLGAFEKHRIFLLGCNGSSSVPPPGDATAGRSLSRRNGRGAS
jgi:hypothetical protein